MRRLARQLEPRLQTPSASKQCATSDLFSALISAAWTLSFILYGHIQLPKLPKVMVIVRVGT